MEKVRLLLPSKCSVENAEESSESLAESLPVASLDESADILGEDDGFLEMHGDLLEGSSDDSEEEADY